MKPTTPPQKNTGKKHGVRRSVPGTKKKGRKKIIRNAKQKPYEKRRKWKLETKDTQKKQQQTPHESFESIQSRYRQCLQSCKSPFDIKIEEAYRILDTQLELTKTENANTYFQIIGIDSWRMKVWSASYHRLSAEITSYKYFPMILPCPRTSVGATIAKVKKTVGTGKDFWSGEIVKEHKPILSRTA